jgi:hypothetical protein
MSELSTAPAETQNVAKETKPVIEAPTQPQIVITEQEVAFSTAAAVQPLPLAKPTRGPIGALRAMFRRSSGDARPLPRHYPPRRDEFLEEAAMEREMHRL